jgi:hypothetical protein
MNSLLKELKIGTKKFKEAKKAFLKDNKENKTSLNAALKEFINSLDVEKVNIISEYVKAAAKKRKLPFNRKEVVKILVLMKKMYDCKARFIFYTKQLQIIKNKKIANKSMILFTENLIATSQRQENGFKRKIERLTDKYTRNFVTDYIKILDLRKVMETMAKEIYDK